MLKKLVPSFFNKDNYVLHYQNFQLYWKLGLKYLKKIHCVLEFNQSQWLKLYVEFNTQKIEAEKNGDKDGKALHKLMKNVVYGKTIESLTNRVDVRIVINERGYLKWASKPNHMSQKIIDKDLVVIRTSKVILTLNKISICWDVYIRFE